MNKEAIDILDEMVSDFQILTEGREFSIITESFISAIKGAKSRIQALGDGWIELDIAYPNKGIDVICQDEDGTTHYAFQCQCKQPGCREWRDQVTGGGLMINPKRWRLNSPKQ